MHNNNKLYEAGRRFGRLVVTRHIGHAGGWRTYECICDCGTVIVESSYHLASHKKSCGCLLCESRSAIGRRNAKDITGMRSGRLVALRLSEKKTARGTPMWLCACDCGGETVARTSQITGQTLGSCGCAGKGVRPINVRRARNICLDKRRKTDVKFALCCRMSNRIRASLKYGKRWEKWQSLVGYSAKDLEDRLKSTIPEGYEWSDFIGGALHIDHIVPLSAHNFSHYDDPDFVRAWSLTNLQLLPARENMKKRASLPYPFQPSFSWGSIQ